VLFESHASVLEYSFASFGAVCSLESRSLFHLLSALELRGFPFGCHFILSLERIYKISVKKTTIFSKALMPVVLATEIGRIEVQGQPGQKFQETPSQQKNCA
jgi:hypothetical protein